MCIFSGVIFLKAEKKNMAFTGNLQLGLHSLTIEMNCYILAVRKLVDVNMNLYETSLCTLK